MTIDPISNIAMTSPLHPVTYYRGSAGSDVQRQRGDNFASSLNNAASSKAIAITDKLELSTGAMVGISVEDLSQLVTQQPQLNPNAPVNKSQSAFKSVLENKKQLSADELITSIETRKKNAVRAKAEEERRKEIEAKGNSGSGYILTIPPEHLDEMKYYQTDYAERNKLLDTFSAYKNSSTGSLVNLTI